MHSPTDSKRIRRNNRCEGSILIAVLAIVFLATVMLYQFVEEAMQELQYRGQLHEDPAIRAVAYSALEVSLGVLHEFRTLDGKLVAPAQGWGRPLDYAGWSPPEGYHVEVQIRDESGKLALNTMTESLLPLLFEEMGLRFSDSVQLTDTLLDWQDEDDLERLNGAEADTYTQYDPPYRAANRALNNWDELRKVEGFRELFFDDRGRPNEAFEQFTRSVSLYHRGEVNLNTANPLVLEFVSRVEGFNPVLLDEYLRGRDGIAGTGDDQILFKEDSGYYTPPEDSARSIASTEASLLRVTVRCSRADTEILLDLLISTEALSTESEDRHIPFNIHRVSENLKIL